MTVRWVNRDQLHTEADVTLCHTMKTQYSTLLLSKDGPISFTYILDHKLKSVR